MGPLGLRCQVPSVLDSQEGEEHNSQLASLPRSLIFPKYKNKAKHKDFINWVLLYKYINKEKKKQIIGLAIY